MFKSKINKQAKPLRKGFLICGKKTLAIKWWSDIAVGTYTTVNQHLNKWAHGKTAPSLTVVLTVRSRNRNWGWRFLPVQRESKELTIQKQERPLQSEPALGSCRQISGYRQRAMWEASKTPSGEPVCAAARRQPGGWQPSILQLPRTSWTCTEVAEGHSLQPKECGRKGGVTLPSDRQP